MAKQELSNLFVRITADTKQFSGAMDRTQRQLGGLTRSVGQLAGAFGVAFGAYGAARFLKGSVQAFAEQEKAVETLRAALIATGNDGSGALDKITASAAELQRVTTAADEAVIQATATLSQLAPSLNADELVSAQSAMIGLAETFTDGNIENAAIAIGKSLGGTVDLLARWGVGVGTAGDASERLGRLLDKTGKFFDVAKARAGTLDGATRQLGNAFGDLKEQVGQVIVEAGSFGDRARTLTQTFFEWGDAVERNRTITVAWIKQISTGVATAFRVLGNVGTIIARLFVQAGLEIAALSARIDLFQQKAANLLPGVNIDTGPAEQRLRDFEQAADEAASAIAKDFRDIGDAVTNLFDQSALTAAAQMGILAGRATGAAGAVSGLGSAGATAAGGIDDAAAALQAFNDRLAQLQRETRTLADIERELPQQLASAVRFAALTDTDPFAGLRARIDTLKVALADAFAVDPFAVTETTRLLSEELLRLQRLLEEMTGTSYDLNINVNGSSAGEAVDSLNQSMQQITAGLPGQFFDLGLQMMGGMGDGMNAGKSIIFGILKSIINKLIAIAVAKLLIFSPSRLAMGWGENVTKGLALGLSNEVPLLERTWRQTLDTITGPELATLQFAPVTIDSKYGLLPRTPDLEPIRQGIDAVYDSLPTAPDLEPVRQGIDVVYDSLPRTPELEPVRQGVDVVYDSLPVAPDLDPMLLRIEYLRDTLPGASNLPTIDQLIAIEYSTLPVAPDLAPIQQLVELEYGGLPTAPDIGTVASPAVSTAPQMDPTVNVYVDSLFADPHAEARKVGSQVFLREGFTVAKESGFRG